MVIMDTENGDQVATRGCLCPQDSRGAGVITPKILEGGIPRILGGISNPNNPLIYATDSSALSLTLVMCVCVCTKRECVCYKEPVYKAVRVRLAFSCQISAISLQGKDSP